MQSKTIHCITLLVALVGLVLPPELSAQIPGLKLEHLSLEHGLSQSTVNAIVQDGQGFMWFGTQDGLNRYDGYSVRVYKHNAADSNSISDNGIWSLLRDTHGDIWIGTMQGGLNRYVVDQDKFIHFRHDPSDPFSISENNVTSVYQDSRGNLWMGTLNNGVNVYDRLRNRFIRVQHDRENPQSLSDNAVWSICEDKHHNVWIATWGGLNKLVVNDSAGASTAQGLTEANFLRYRHDAQDRASLSSDNVRTIYVDRSGTLWVGTWGGGLNRYDETADSFRQYRFDPNDPGTLSSVLVLSLREDSQRNLWVGTGDGGLNLLNPASGSFTRFRHDPSNPKSLNNNIICSIYEDRSGTLWIGTGAGGINWYDRKKNKFPHYRKDESGLVNLSGNDVSSIIEDKWGELWIGTYGNGLNRFDRKKNRIIQYRHDPDNPHSLSHNNIFALHESRNGDLWIGTDGGGLNRFDRAKNQFIRYRHNPKNPNSLAQDEVTAILETINGGLWLGTTGRGVDRFDRSGNLFVHYRHEENNPHSLGGNTVMVVYEDHKGDIWIGTYGEGAHRYDPTMDSFIRYQHNPEDPRSLSNNTVMSIYEDNDGILWLGTYAGGLNRFDRTTEKFTHVTEAEGLPNNVIYGILPDDKGNLWLSTNKGLAKYNPRTGSVRNYDVTDGLQGNEFNQWSHFRSKTGEIFIGGINGFNAFFPDSIRDNPYIPPVVLTSFKVFDQPVALDRSITVVDAIQLSYDQNFFSLEFVALNYTSQEKNQYAYMLEGLDASWIAAGTRRYASYTNLDPGDYVLRVKGSNNDGIWNEHGVSIAVTITPPYWKTWWFRIGAVVTGTGLLFLMYRYRVRKLLEIERIRASIATDLHDDIGSTLTEIALFSDVGLRELRNHSSDRPISETEVRKVGALLDDIGRTSRGLIDAMNDIVWAIDPKNDSFDFLLLRMKNHAARIMEAKGINYEIEIPEELSSLRLPLGFRRRFFLIFKEAINNIIRHANPTKVVLTIKREKDWLVMTIMDNGAGFDLAAAGQGNGLRNMHKRAASLNGSLSISSAVANGTTIILRAMIP